AIFAGLRETGTAYRTDLVTSRYKETPRLTVSHRWRVDGRAIINSIPAHTTMAANAKTVTIRHIGTVAIF
ncbi:hypothetical protein, partial [Mycobacteroides chelonae]|uniref:hypothetical protein n=1 Tax=Mycobacteroides chelonae TaxID=1774 RepID=UPI001E5E7DB1